MVHDLKSKIYYFSLDPSLNLLVEPKNTVYLPMGITKIFESYVYSTKTTLDTFPHGIRDLKYFLQSSYGYSGHDDSLIHTRSECPGG